MREDIISFIDNTGEDYPFNIQMCGISYCDGTYRIERKCSSIYCFEYIIKGQGTIVVDGEELYPSEGDVYILHKGDKHLYYSDVKSPWTKIWFNISGSLVDHLINVYKLNNTYHIENLDLKDLFDNFIITARSQRENKNGALYNLSLIFHEIILNIYNRVKAPDFINNPTALKLKHYLDNHVESNVTVKQLADYAYKSPSQIIRIFKNEFGITPYDYLLVKKIETAKLLLLNTNISIKQIAVTLKFADEHYFSNYFKSKVGVSPTGYRNQAMAKSL